MSCRVVNNGKLKINGQEIATFGEVKLMMADHSNLGETIQGMCGELNIRPRAPKTLKDALKLIRQLRLEAETANINESAIRAKYNESCNDFHKAKNMNQWHATQIDALKTAVTALTKAVGA